MEPTKRGTDAYPNKQKGSKREGHLQAETAPMGIKNMAKKRAPSDVDPVAIAFPTAATSINPKMCSDRSLVLELVQVTQTDTKKVPNHTGAVSHSVSIRP